MSEHLFNPDNFTKEGENFNPELLAGEGYDLDKVKKDVQPKTKAEDEPAIDYETISGCSFAELLKKGPEPFVKTLGEQVERSEELARQKRAEVENNLGILPKSRQKYYQEQSQAIAIAKTKATLNFYKKKGGEMQNRLERALEEQRLRLY